MSPPQVHAFAVHHVQPHGPRHAAIASHRDHQPHRLSLSLSSSSLFHDDSLLPLSLLYAISLLFLLSAIDHRPHGNQEPLPATLRQPRCHALLLTAPTANGQAASERPCPATGRVAFPCHRPCLLSTQPLSTCATLALDLHHVPRRRRTERKGLPTFLESATVISLLSFSFHKRPPLFHVPSLALLLSI